jgi:hypothetical protein
MNGLVSLYNFCGNGNDASGNNHNLVNYGAVLASDRYGSASTAYSFGGSGNASGDYFLFSDTLTGSGNWTYSAWAYPTASQIGMIFSNGNSGSNGYGLVINGGSMSSPGTSMSLFLGGIMYVPSAPLSLNAWHHGVIRRSNGKITLFVDGVKADSTMVTPNPPGSPNKFSIGREGANGYSPFQGKIDEVAVYNRALTDAEVLQLYNANCSVFSFTQPTSQSVSIGSTAQFTVGTPVQGYTYQWQINTESGWVNLSNSATYSGVTTSTLSVQNVQTGLSGAQYRCVITNVFCCSTTTSGTATLTVTASTGVSDKLAPQQTIQVARIDGNHIQLTWEGTGVTRWTLFDMAGRKLQSDPIESTVNSVNIPMQLTPGIYILSVATNTGNLLTQKLLVD